MAYIGKGLDNGVRNRFIYSSTQGQTAFTGSDLDGKTLTISDALYTDVYHNGVKIKLTTDWSSSTTTMTLVTGASVNDVIEIISFDSFGVPDTVPASTGGTFGGGISATTGTFSGDVAMGVGSNITLNSSIGQNSTTAYASMDGRIFYSNDYSNIPRGPNKVVLQNDGTWISGLGISSNSLDIYSGGDIKFNKSTSTTAFTKQVTILSAGGIAFNNDTAAANALDDYEEGTFTPTDASGVSLTFTGAHGLYTKIGRSVTFSMQVVYPSQSNANNAVVTGLPFASNNSSDASFTAISKVSNGGDFDPLVYKNTVYVRFYNFTGASKTNANFNAKYLHISGSYQTA